MTIDELERVKRAVLRRYTISAGVSFDKIKLELSGEVPTAAVAARKDDNGVLKVEKILVNPEFFDLLNFREKVFVLAHEMCHIALKHFNRYNEKPLKDINREYEEYCKNEKDEKKRKVMYERIKKKYDTLWNIATDACINAFLKRDGLSFPDNIINPKTGKKMDFVYMDDGLIKSAEKIYDDLVEKYKKIEEQMENQNNNSSGEKNQGEKQFGGNLDDFDISDYNGIDSHEEWNDNDELNNDSKSNNDNKSNNNEQGKPKDIDINKEIVNEENVFKKEYENRERIKQNEENINPEAALKAALSKLPVSIEKKESQSVKPVISWKRILLSCIERETEDYGKRRANRYNPNPRLENKYEEGPLVEVILDTSETVSNDLLKGFLLQLITIFDYVYGEDMYFKVGCFNEEFSGFEVIKNKKEIIDYEPKRGQRTFFELAASSFSKQYGVTKIVFTDGILGFNPKTETKDVIWIVFGDKMNFTPNGGRIIRVSDKDYNDMISEVQNYMSIRF